MQGARDRRIVGIVSAVAIIMVILFGVFLRLGDPQSTPVMAAEDPYNHMALVREHTRDGSLDPLNPEGGLYPPGMHAFVAAAVAYSGADLYHFMIFSPVLLGAIGILGVGLLLWRLDGPLAAVVGAAAYAVAPEVIFRTTMMAPTALDLALLPFFLLSMLELARGRVEWAAAAGPIALYLVFSHPWIVPVLAAASAAFAMLAIILPWPAKRGRPLDRTGVAIAVGILGVAFATSLSGCAGYCGGGLGEILPDERLAPLAPLIGLAAVGLALLIARGPPGVDRILSRNHAATDRLVARGAASAAIFLLFLFVTLRALEIGLPEFVDLPAMVGWPVLLLAAAAFIALPFIPGPAAHIGFALSVVTFPFVIFNPLDSPFWPHRTAVYLGLGLAILAGVAAGAAGRAAAAAFAWSQRRPSAKPWRATRPAVAALPALLIVGSMAGTVLAATPEPAKDWYRLYNDCEFEGLRNVSAQATNDEDTLVITGDWQAKLVLAALTPNASRVWYKPELFTDPAERDRFTTYLQDARTPTIVVVEKYLAAETPGAQTDFLNATPWMESGAWCQREGAESPRVAAYTLQGDDAS